MSTALIFKVAVAKLTSRKKAIKPPVKKIMHSIKLTIIVVSKFVLIKPLIITNITLKQVTTAEAIKKFIDQLANLIRLFNASISRIALSFIRSGSSRAKFTNHLALSIIRDTRPVATLTKLPIPTIRKIGAKANWIISTALGVRIVSTGASFLNLHNLICFNWVSIVTNKTRVMSKLCWRFCAIVLIFGTKTFCNPLFILTRLC